EQCDRVGDGVQCGVVIPGGIAREPAMRKGQLQVELAEDLARLEVRWVTLVQLFDHLCRGPDEALPGLPRANDGRARRGNLVTRYVKETHRGFEPVFSASTFD